MNTLNHLAVIPDGNRRWAKERGLAPYLGHFYGIKKFYDVLDWWLNRKIKIISFYMLSYENLLNRSREELRFLFRFLNEELEKVLSNKNNFLDKIRENKVRIRFVGLLEKLPSNILDKMKELMDITENFNSRVLNLLVAYGGRVEILNAIRKLDLSEFDEEKFRRNLWVKEDVDLIIRTGGCHRLSNLLIYQSAYAEIYVIDKYWPDISSEDLDKALAWYYNVKRNFGH